MPSAILLFYTSDGFLIAADGRSRINGVKSNDEVTKIFEISGRKRLLAYAFGGSVAMTDKQSADVILFDFRTEMLKAIGSLANEKYPDLPSYANVLASTLFGGLTAYQKHERAEPFKNELIACLFIAGYFNKSPLGSSLNSSKATKFC